MKRVAIVGVAQSKFEAAKKELAYSEMVFEASSAALKDTGITRDDIDQVMTASQDFWDGRTISNFAVSDACGSYLKPESKAAMDASMAVFYSLARIMSGQYKTGLVATHCKMSQGPQNAIYNAVFDPMYQRQLGLDFVNAHAFQARAYMEAYKVGPEEWAQVVVKNKGNALKNEKAMDGRKLTAAEVLKSPVLADPLRELDILPVCDGSAAIVLAEEETAKKICKKPVWINGIASFMDAYYFGDRDLSDPVSLRKSAQKAYTMAGIKNPAQEIDVAEISEFVSYQELLWAEGLGLCDRGQGGKLIADKISTLDGSLPINPSGGVLAGNPHTVAGLVRVIEAYLQLTGQAGAHQVKDGKAKTAVAHGTTGPCGQSHCVIVLGV